jgi:hypothetical protein
MEGTSGCSGPVNHLPSSLLHQAKAYTEQYERQQVMGKTLARRLGKVFHFGMVVQNERKRRRLKALGHRVVIIRAEEPEAGLGDLAARLGS